jgi:hypothetical protein
VCRVCRVCGVCGVCGMCGVCGVCGVTFDIPQTALVATLDTYDFLEDKCLSLLKINYVNTILRPTLNSRLVLY